MPLDDLPRPLAFVLGGGGSLGAVQVGMLRALVERQVAPDLVVGTSVGSLNGAFLAYDPLGVVGRLEVLWRSMTRQTVFPGNLLAQARTLRQGRTHLFPDSGLRAVIEASLPPETTFADLLLPFAAVTVDVGTATPYVVRHGPLVPALLASAAIPGIFPAVALDGRRLYDGGLVANVPVTQALDLGAQSIVVLDTGFPGQLPAAPTTLAETMLFTATVAMRTQTVLEAPVVARQVPVVYVAVPPVVRVNFLDFSHTDALMRSAYDVASSFLDAVRVEGPGLYGSPGQ